jgi:hypothetical protein
VIELWKEMALVETAGVKRGGVRCVVEEMGGAGGGGGVEVG